ncbi:MAG: hypothetical protein ACJ77K_19510 [Bacteroidia bacterium]
MDAMQKIRSILVNKYSILFFVFFVIFTLDRHHRWEVSTDPDKYGPFETDVAHYYSYLPDLYKPVDSLKADLQVNIRTIGMAIMYAPAFAVADIVARVEGAPRDGYSWPYKWAIRWGSIIYVFLGLLFCRKNLRMFFSDFTTAVTLTCIFFGTNLFYYTYSLGEFPHSYLFFLYSVIIYLSIGLVDDYKNKNLLWIGLLGGLITLIRPTDILILLFPLLYRVGSFRELKARIRRLASKKKILLFSALLFCIPLFAQMCIWKIIHGSFFYDSYHEYRFFFTDPQISNFLFSYLKGWLLYTPMMVLSLIGILLSVKRFPQFFSFLILFIPLNIYILSCWFDWAYGGSFGCRVMVQSYAVLAFPFAVIFSRIWELFYYWKWIRRSIRTILVIVLFLVIQLNLFQSWQSRILVIHWAGMNERIYKYVFLNDHITKEELIYLHSIATPLDYGKLFNGQRELPENY